MAIVSYFGPLNTPIPVFNITEDTLNLFKIGEVTIIQVSIFYIIILFGYLKPVKRFIFFLIKDFYRNQVIFYVLFQLCFALKLL